MHFLIYQNLLIFDEKLGCQQDSKSVSRDSYFFIFFRYSIIVLSFIIVGYVWQILGRRFFADLSPAVSSPENIDPE